MESWFYFALDNQGGHLGSKNLEPLTIVGSLPRIVLQTHHQTWMKWRQRVDYYSRHVSN